MESNLYNPAGQPKDWLIANFVARNQVFNKIFKDLLTGKMQYPEQHYLIQGQRGMGKTTLLLRLKYEIENTPELNDWLVPVFFNEESYDLTSLSNLWEKLLKYLDNLWQTGGEYYSKTDEFVGRDDYERLCFDLLSDILKERRKKLVILFDNFGQLFLDNLSDKEQHRFREILMNCADLRIIGASAVVLQDLHDYSKPFFEFFKVINLDGLNKKETLELISKLQENSPVKIDLEKNKAKIETLAILTGGVIRTIMLIYEVILADEDGTALRDLETILDRITPLYKHRIEDLPVQQRKIIDVIAKRWDAISTKEIAENIREDGKPMATKLISAQLQQLEKNNVIEKKQTNTKNHLYQLKERFFNIWYLMRNGNRFDRCRVMWLTKFLEAWYEEKNEIEEFIKRHVELLQSGKYLPTSAIMIAEALTSSRKVNLEYQAILIRATQGILNDEQKKLLPPVVLDKFETAVKLREEKRYLESINLLQTLDQRIIEVNVLLFDTYRMLNQADIAITLINKENKLKPFLLALAYIDLEKYEDAKKSFEKVLAVNFKDSGIDKGAILFNIGILFDVELKDINNAIRYFTLSIENGFDEAYEPLIDLYIKNNDYKSAEKYLWCVQNTAQKHLEKKLIAFYILKIGEQDKVVPLVTDGLKKHPEDVDYKFFKAMVELNNGQLEQVEQLLLNIKDELKKNIDVPDYYKAAITTLCSIYVANKDKTNALLMVNEVGNPSVYIEYLLKIIIAVWNNQFDETLNLIDQCFNKSFATSGDNYGGIENLLISLLIAKKQYHLALMLFKKNGFNFMEKLKPLYYTLMRFLRDEYPNEHLRMGEEFQQPVNDIIKNIEEMAVIYA